MTPFAIATKSHCLYVCNRYIQEDDHVIFQEGSGLLNSDVKGHHCCQPEDLCLNQRLAKKLSRELPFPNRYHNTSWLQPAKLKHFCLLSWDAAQVRVDRYIPAAPLQRPGWMQSLEQLTQPKNPVLKTHLPHAIKDFHSVSTNTQVFPCTCTSSQKAGLKTNLGSDGRTYHACCDGGASVWWRDRREVWCSHPQMPQGATRLLKLEDWGHWFAHFQRGPALACSKRENTAATQCAQAGQLLHFSSVSSFHTSGIYQGTVILILFSQNSLVVIQNVLA